MMESRPCNSNDPANSLKPKLLVIELWGLGDLAMATPFLQAAIKKFDVTILAKGYGKDLQARLWPEVTLITCNLPWTAFRKKYHLWNWPWKTLFQLISKLRVGKFDVAVSARWDPRDHLLMWLAGAKTRLGFPRIGSAVFLSKVLERLPGTHRYEYWRKLGHQLGLEMPDRNERSVQKPRGNTIIVHTGGSQPSKIWPLRNFKSLSKRIKEENFDVKIICDPRQRDWWLAEGETDVVTPKDVSDLITYFDSATAFIGNDSGPGHVAAMCGVPTLTIFGPSFPEEFAPLHPKSQWIEGEACLFKPCKDYCRFPEPRCLYELDEKKVWERTKVFLSDLKS